MTTLLLVLHIVVCFFLVAIVLLQHGKGADMGATFGGSSQAVFGAEGPIPLLNKVTTGAAIIFMITSLTLAWVSTQAGKETVMEEALVQPVPVAPLERTPTAIPLPDAPPPEAETETAPQEFPGEEIIPQAIRDAGGGIMPAEEVPAEKSQPVEAASEPVEEKK